MTRVLAIGPSPVRLPHPLRRHLAAIRPAFLTATRAAEVKPDPRFGLAMPGGSWLGAAA